MDPYMLLIDYIRQCNWRLLTTFVCGCLQKCRNTVRCFNQLEALRCENIFKQFACLITLKSYETKTNDQFKEQLRCSAGTPTH